MRRTGRLIEILAVTLPLTVLTNAALAQGSFEGTVTYQMMKSGDANQPASTSTGTMVYMAKGDQARLEINSSDPKMAKMGGMVALYDQAHQKMYMVMPQIKGYMDLSSTIAETQKHTDSAMNNGQFQKTGSETVAGIPCDDYQGKGDKGKLDFACVAHGMGSWIMFKSSNGMAHGMNNSALASMFKQGFFPLKMGTIEDGKEVPMMVATNVTRKTLDPSIFTLPSDYQDMSKMGAAAMGAMMQNGGNQKP